MHNAGPGQCSQHCECGRIRSRVSCMLEARGTQQMKMFTHAGCFVQHAACWVCGNLFGLAYPAMLALLGRERDVSKGLDQCRGVALEGLIRHGAQQARNGMKGSQRKSQGSPEVCGHQMTLRGATGVHRPHEQLSQLIRG